MPQPPEIRRPFSRWALFLSVLLHVLLVIALLDEALIWGRLKHEAETTVEVELVPAPAPPKPNPPPPPPAAPPPQATPPPEPPPPVPAHTALPRSLPPPPPQLSTAPLARHSTGPGRQAGSGAAVTAVFPVLGLEPGQSGKAAGRKGEQGGELTQTEQDFILAQIVKYWHVDLHVPEAHGLVLSATIVIEADGTLASPLSKDDPWNPAAVIDGYAGMVAGGYSFRRQAIEGFLLALRLCQPLKLPPGGEWPRHMTLRFAFDDL